MSVILTDQEYADESGQKYDRVSSVTRLVYIDDPFQFVKAKDMQVATDRGSAVHRLTSNEAEAGDEEWKDWAEGWINFKQDTGYIELGAEKPVHSKIYRFAGTPDSWGVMPPALKGKGAAGVVEKKTTASIPLTIGLQTAPYQAALNEMHPKGIVLSDSLVRPIYRLDNRTIDPIRPIEFTHRWVVWLRPTFPRGYKLISEGDTVLLNGKRVPLLSPTDWQTFVGLLMLKRWRERYLKPETKKEITSEPERIEWR